MKQVSILGASGYSGAELVRIILRHPHLQIDKLFANSMAGTLFSDTFPEFRKRADVVMEKYAPELTIQSDIIFLALPSGEAMKLAPAMLEGGKVVIDLGGDFRLKSTAEYERYYKHTHSSPELLSAAHYSLADLPENEIQSATLIANPGCYPTSALLPLIPLLREMLISPQGIVINSLSGVSGAGRKADLSLSFCEVNESVKAYKAGEHQHIPEIRQALEKAAGAAVSFSFIPHLIPITRGIYTTIHANLASDVTEEKIHTALNLAYTASPFVHLTKQLPEIRAVQHTNRCDISFRLLPETRQVVLFSTIDNLVKGAAGQAIQNLNLRMGWDAALGLM
ncbi:MAG: N-acetyl-gamma-glutamyl-phosphate reductase [Chloroherpetonaceae bacterium]|nr:N-acetyl-gamma-glutamyl-phosphate reductase [Chloroherpetonaceae bacterium]